MIYLLDAMSLHELIDLATHEGLVLDAPACQECNSIGLQLHRDDEPVTVQIPTAMTLLRQMLRVHYGDPIIVEVPSDLIV
jgi:hypothetical protein